MNIHLENAGRRYSREWIFRGVNHLFTPDNPCVLIGSNGSGKSTLLKVISGHLETSKGTVSYQKNDDIIPVEQIFREVAIAAPYLHLFEEYTLEEQIRFQGQFKPFREGIEASEVPALLQLENAKDKFIKNLSSGMKQRLQLGMAILSNASILLLDEPVSNLDKNGHAWYARLIEEHTAGRTVIVCSNQNEAEHFFCKEQLQVEDFK